MRRLMLRRFTIGRANFSNMSVSFFGRCTALLLVVLCISCASASSYQVARVASANGNLEAVLTETNGGATTSFGYDVTVRARGAKNGTKVASLYGAIRNEQAFGVNLLWANDHVLRIQYLRARSVMNMLKTVDVSGQQVEIVMQSGIEDSQA